jgi:hypothetical protein
MTGLLATTLTAAPKTASVFKLPLVFEENRGQAPEPVRFISRGGGYTLLMSEEDTLIVPRKSEGPSTTETRVRIKMRGSKHVRPSGARKLAGKTNYLVGNDSARWILGAATYEAVQYSGLYPGVDLVYYGNEGELEFDFVVHPGGDTTSISIAFDGADAISLDTVGGVLITAGGAEMRLRRPLVYQLSAGKRYEVAGEYVIGEGRQLSFRIGSYDRSRPLVIDPVLSYGTYLGGKDNKSEDPRIAVDSSGTVYVAGTTLSLDFLTSNALQGANAGWTDAFVAKLNASGTEFVYSTYIGGKFMDFAGGIAVDGSGNVILAGHTLSPDFPIVGGFQSRLAGTKPGDEAANHPDAFVMKLNDTGSSIIFSSYLGGWDDENTRAVAVDADGNAYITGLVVPSADFPTVNAAQPVPGGSADIFVSKVSTSGASLVYSTYLGGFDVDEPFGLAVDREGSVYVTGVTRSHNFPTVNAYQGELRGFTFLAMDAFVTKISPSGSQILYSTYLGGNEFDVGYGIAVDKNGAAWVAGGTLSPDFPTVLPLQDKLQPYSRAAGFLAKLDSSGSALVYSTYLGGSLGDSEATAVAVDQAGNAYVTGWTGTNDFPLVNAIPGGRGLASAFVAQVNSDPLVLVYSTYVVPQGMVRPTGIGADAKGNAYIVGHTNFPNLATADAALTERRDVFIAKIAADTPQ